jgi:hypothetical protein
MLRRLPVFPLFGRGQTQPQPAYVEDVADAIARVMQNAQPPMCYELGGPRVYAYRSLLEVIARHLGEKPLLISIPFGLWHALASVAEMLPEPPITRNQVELMQLDNVASPGGTWVRRLGDFVDISGGRASRNRLCLGQALPRAAWRFMDADGASTPSSEAPPGSCSLGTPSQSGWINRPATSGRSLRQRSRSQESSSSPELSTRDPAHKPNQVPQNVWKTRSLV